MRNPANELRKLANQWRAVARDADQRAARDAIPPATRQLLAAQASARRACAEDLTRVLKETGLND